MDLFTFFMKPFIYEHICYETQSTNLWKESNSVSLCIYTGLSDPFCTLFLSSSTAHRYNTSVKQETLNPVWEEHFSL